MNFDDVQFFDSIANAGSDFRVRGRFSKQSMLQLVSVFGEALVSRALEILDGQSDATSANPAVVRVVAERSKREVLMVRGTSGSSYHILTTSNWCACDAWTFRTWRKSDSITCKHVLAAHLAVAMNVEGQRQIKEDQFVIMLAEMNL